MRKMGVTLLLLGILGFFYASSRIGDLEPVPDGLGARETLQYPAGRWMIARYAGATVAGMGLLVLLFPKGR
jgi:hypothetical protein